MNRLKMTACILLLSTGAAMAEPAMTAKGAGGAMLTDAAGMTLYTFDKDTAGVSNCAGECVANWPILAATATDKAQGDYAVIKRADGKLQWTYKGKPLYTFIKDANPGDMTGDGVKQVWRIARP